MSTGKLDELFRNWLALHETDHQSGKDDDEADHLTDEMIVLERAILAGTAETDDDRRAQVAMLAYYAVHTAPYANYEVLEQWYRRLVVERLSDPSVRIAEREGGRKRIHNAREHLSEIEDEAPEVRS